MTGPKQKLRFFMFFMLLFLFRVCKTQTIYVMAQLLITLLDFRFHPLRYIPIRSRYIVWLHRPSVGLHILLIFPASQQRSAAFMMGNASVLPCSLPGEASNNSWLCDCHDII